MKIQAVLCMSLLVAASAFGVDPQKSTPQERTRALEIINKLEKSPMDPSLKDDRDWVFQWVKSSDVNALVCTSIIKPLADERPSPQRNALMLQNILASARFSIEHPESKDTIAMFQASTEGMIRAYENIVKSDPTKKDEFMESLIAKRDKGLLLGYVKRGAAECSKHTATQLQP